MILPFVSVALASQAFLSPITPIAYASYYNDKPAYEYSSNVQAPSYSYQSYVRSGDVDPKFVKIAAPVLAAAPAPVIAAAPSPVIAAKAVAVAPAPVAFAQPAILRAEPSQIAFAQPAPVAFAQPAPVAFAQPAPVAFAQPTFLRAEPAPVAAFVKAQPAVVRVEQAPTFVKAAPAAATFYKAEPAPVFRTAYYTAPASAPAFYAAPAPAFRYASFAQPAFYQAEEKKPEAKLVEFAPAFAPRQVIVSNPVATTYAAPALRFAQPAAILPTLRATPAQVVDTVQEVKVTDGVLATKTQYHTQNALGEATYGHSEPTQSHVAVQDAAGNKAGTFSYIAADGRLLTTNYVADEGGYRVASNALPKDEQPAVFAN